MDISPHDVDQRLTELEIKASFAEDLVEQLNQVVIRQQQQIDALIAEVGRLREAARAQPGDVAPRDPGDERPPHY